MCLQNADKVNVKVYKIDLKIERQHFLAGFCVTGFSCML